MCFETWQVAMAACGFCGGWVYSGILLSMLRRERKRELWLTTGEVVIIAGASVPCQSVAHEPGRCFENRQHFEWMADRLVEISKKYDRDAEQNNEH